MKIIIKYSYIIVVIIFALSLLSVVLLKEHISTELARLIIDYFFWYSFGLFSGFSALKWMFRYQRKESRKDNK
ncbi:MAG: hypothetical protein MI739_05190 [Bacteroidales bacterium]|nr:hypothetical protein [Bacteroidales bacterium]